MPQPTARLHYLDATRALAIIGMAIAHIGGIITLPAAVEHLVAGRASIMFAVLAGISLILLTRRLTPAQGRRAVATRAFLIGLLGLILPFVSFGPVIILGTYGVLMACAIPLLRVRNPSVLALAAAVSAVVLPCLSYWLRATYTVEVDIIGVPDLSLFTSLELFRVSMLNLVLTGIYPVLTWIPFLLAGLALGRWILTGTATPSRLLGGGTVLAIGAYGVSAMYADRFAQWVLHTQLANARAQGFSPELARLTTEEVLSAGYGTTLVGNPLSLLIATPHSGSITEILGGIGVTMVALGCCQWLGQRWPWPVRPLSDLGRMALTYYVGHILVFDALGLLSFLLEPATIMVLALVVMIGLPLVLAPLYFRRYQRGPLESVLARASRRAVAGRGKHPTVAVGE